MLLQRYSVETRMGGKQQVGHNADMTWTVIRLELGRTAEFPDGSPSRFYLLRLPVRADGQLDERELREHPGRATVRRFWPNQADVSGYVISNQGRWAFSYRPGDGDDERIYHLETHPIRLGEYLTLTEPDGQQLPFRVADLTPIGQFPETD